MTTTVVEIDDPGDPRVAPFVGLTDADLRRAYEAEHAIFIAEGALVIRQAVATGHELTALLVTPAKRAALADVVAAIDAPVYVASQAVMDAVAGFPIHRGAVATVRRPAPRAAAEVISAGRRLAILEGLNDQENLGVVFRNAAGLDVDGVLLSPTCCDPLYRRVVRVSMGHVLTVPFARVEPWPSVLSDVRAAGFAVAALTPAGDVELRDAALDERDRVALLLGAEGPGLTDGALALADVRVRIGMAPLVDSLNVAAAAAIAFYSARPAADDT